ncbi:hypothetical protein QA640_46280 (plasmid) [Bradyrhizobium sp. CB82]|uniref:hypothetical protein n=1 Tax=Bradyrhizobium sp. CB82 TaxID=3039159 RepID=UPI0024B0BDCB|nr:hypothetical protein [Bradyrhizobium sp. CB82]WFU45430.1 hypothetical protein QA640_46280 [Bradyrhizobium sp. CB82]
MWQSELLSQVALNVLQGLTRIEAGRGMRRAGLFESGPKSIEKSDAARRSAPPHHTAARRRLEAVRRQIKIGRKNVKRAMQFSSPLGDVLYYADVYAGNSIKMKHRGLVDFNTL